MSDEKPVEKKPSAEDLTKSIKPGEEQLNEDKLNKISGGVTTSRSDGGGATVGRAQFPEFTVNKGID